MSGFDLRKHSEIDRYINFEGYGFIKGLLFDLGAYPAAIASSGKIFGELYRVSDPLKLLSRSIPNPKGNSTSSNSLSVKYPHSV